ncbi:DUF1273 domain-containing protein [Deltaproteobacteria bacterium OttesenSCG-928-K17]|nr:DUF1273 domain-containing protein [Deltaproteobacteria bacterium OttesenSCG-928-K17]
MIFSDRQFRHIVITIYIMFKAGRGAMKLSHTACFSGYRPEKLPFPLEAGCEPYINLQAAITRAIEESVLAGYTRFLSGMARGFDLVCSCILLEMKKNSPAYTDIELVAVLPFAGHGFKGRWGDIHDMVLGKASEIITLPSQANQQAYLNRNRFMVEQSSRLLCYYDGQPGGTAHTFHCAIQNGLEILNLADDCYSRKRPGGCNCA